MNIEDYNFELPDELIAKHPTKERSSSRLLVLSEPLQDKKFSDILDSFNSGDLLVINDTKVFNARLEATKSTGGKVEILIERKIDENNVLALTKSNRPLKINERLKLNDSDIFADILNKDGYLSLLKFSENVDDIIETSGSIPLPPYIDRKPQEVDSKRYQTIYANDKEMRSVAAPTAGLHFEQQLLDKIKSKGVNVVSITLDIGIGTFMPIKENDITKHKMHSEKIYLSSLGAKAIDDALKSDARIFCVGTTSLRCLESIFNKFGEIRPFEGETDVFIYPGYNFKVADYLITNFHLPRTTLLLLVSAFAGVNEIKRGYQHAVEQKYRFFSYGDAMLLRRKE